MLVLSLEKEVPSVVWLVATAYPGVVAEGSGSVFAISEEESEEKDVPSVLVADGVPVVDASEENEVPSEVVSVAEE